MTAQGPDGKLVFANETAVRALGFSSVDDLVNTPTEVVRDRFEMWREDGSPFPPMSCLAAWPSRARREPRP